MNAMHPGPKFCSTCGRPLRPRARFCAGCGKAIVRANIQPPYIPPVAPLAPRIPPAIPPHLSPQPIPPRPIPPSKAQGSSASPTSGPNATNWLKTVFYICLALSILALLVTFSSEISQGINLAISGLAGFFSDLVTGVWAFVQEAFKIVLFILFFPFLLSLGLIIVGGITSMVISGAGDWSLILGLWLLSQPWWWFPVGQIVGFIVVIVSG